MSNVVKGRRGPGHFRAAMHLTFGCVLLGGCSAGFDRFDSSSFGSGYDAAPSAKAAAAPSQKVAADTSQTAQQASYRTQPQSGYMLASASQGQQGGYLQVSRVDLPPLPQATPAQGTKTADGYGPYNQPPISDGSYTGPRVYTPYEEPRGDAPPPAAYAPDQGDPRGYDRGTQPPPVISTGLRTAGRAARAHTSRSPAAFTGTRSPTRARVALDMTGSPSVALTLHRVRVAAMPRASG